MTIYYTPQDIYTALCVIAVPFALYLLRRLFYKYQQYKQRWTDMIEEKRQQNELRLLTQHEGFISTEIVNHNEVLVNWKTLEEELQDGRETLENFSLTKYHTLDMPRIKNANPRLRNDLKLSAASASK